jgi:hypothetical protein
MTDEDKLAALAEANRLGEIILKAQQRCQQARPRSRAAYHAHELRARKNYDRFALTVRDRGYFLDGPLTAHTIHEMDEEQQAEYRRWKGAAQ